MTTITTTNESHLDHGLTPVQVSHILRALNEKKGRVVVGPFGPFFIATINIPKSLGSVPCSLVGPATGGSPVADADTFAGVRGSRPNPSRLTRLPATRTRRVTVVVIGNDDKSPGAAPQRVDTAFGGPLAPREVGDPTLPPEGLAESVAFWSAHALNAESFGL